MPQARINSAEAEDAHIPVLSGFPGAHGVADAAIGAEVGDRGPAVLRVQHLNAMIDAAVKEFAVGVFGIGLALHQ